MKDLTLFYCSFHYCSSQYDFTIRDEFIRNTELSIEVLVILELAGSCEQVEEAGEQVHVLACHI